MVRSSNNNSVADSREFVLDVFQTRKVLEGFDICPACLDDVGLDLNYLYSRGVNLQVLSQHINAGLDLQAFALSLRNGLKVRSFNQREVGADCSEFNTCLQFFNENSVERSNQPGARNRVLEACYGEAAFRVVDNAPFRRSLARVCGERGRIDTLCFN